MRVVLKAGCADTSLEDLMPLSRKLRVPLEARMLSSSFSTARTLIVHFESVMADTSAVWWRGPSQVGQAHRLAVDNAAHRTAGWSSMMLCAAEGRSV
jgi:hypothetical protein